MYEEGVGQGCKNGEAIHERKPLEDVHIKEKKKEQMGRFRSTCTPTSEHAGLYNHTASWPFQNFRWLGLAHLTSLAESLSVA